VDEILLLTNGPGELSTWVPPVLRHLRERFPGARVELFLIRDQFATGTEERKAKDLALDKVSARSEFFARMTSRKRMPTGLVLMLGGAPRDAVLLGRATGYPSFSYSFNGKAWHAGLSGFAVDSEASKEVATRRGGNPQHIFVAGNLVMDTLQDGLAQHPEVPEFDVLLFPSSRPFALKYMLGFMLAALEQVQMVHPGIRVAWVKSRLLPDEVVSEALSGRLVRDIGGVGGRLQGEFITSEGGLQVAVLDEPLRYSAMKKAKVGLSIPGTTTLEEGFSNLPGIVLLPLHKPEAIPVPIEGIVHWLGLLPGGKWLRFQLIRWGQSRYKYLALPNIMLDQPIYPELRGIFGIKDVADALLDVLRPERQQEIRGQLKRLEAQPGAERLVEWVVEMAGQKKEERGRRKEES
jgi:lipid-A-disaccharide synthase